MALGENLKRKSPANSGKKKPAQEKPEMLADQEVVQEQMKKDEPKTEQTTGLDQMDPIDVGKDSVQIVVFPVENEEYAFDISMVKEVVNAPAIAPLPHVENYILGVANIRGNVMAILDLSQKLGFVDKKDTSSYSYVMVIKDDVFQIALAVGKVPATMVVKKSEISPPSGVMMKNNDDQKFLTGIIRKDKRMIMVLDVVEMLNMKDN